MDFAFLLQFKARPLAGKLSKVTVNDFFLSGRKLNKILHHVSNKVYRLSVGSGYTYLPDVASSCPNSNIDLLNLQAFRIFVMLIVGSEG